MDYVIKCGRTGSWRTRSAILAQLYFNMFSEHYEYVSLRWREGGVAAMGTVQHKALLVTGLDEPAFREVHRWAFTIFGDLVSGIVQAQRNGYATFMIAPDGGNEGRPYERDMTEMRRSFQKHCHNKPVQCVFVSYGELGDDIIYP